MNDYLFSEKKVNGKSDNNNHASRKKKSKLLKNRSIKKKLVFSFSLVMVIFLITVLCSVLTCIYTSKHVEYLKELYDINETCDQKICTTLEIQNNMLNIISNYNNKNDYIQDLNNNITVLVNSSEKIELSKCINEQTKQKWLNSIENIKKIKDDIINTYRYSGTERGNISNQNKYLQEIVLANINVNLINDEIKAELYKSLNGVKTKAIIFIVCIVILFLVGLIISRIAANQLTSRILNPIGEIEKISTNLANGKLHNEIKYESDDELGQMLKNIDNTTNIISSYINNISHNLEKLSTGDMNIEFNIEYVGEYSKIRNSMIEISNSLNDTFYAINRSTEQVASGAEQVASGSQELSQGAVEQSCSIDNLSNSINEITEEAKNNSSNALEASKFSEEVKVKVNRGYELMNEMLNAMDNISKMSNEIGNIVKNIDSIAFQTNILSLNAAVEAARAGDAGRGFSVVADEVGVLSKKSAESAHNTTDLINDAVDAINKGTIIAQETASALEEIVSVTQKSTCIISDIAKGTDKQMQSIKQVALGVEQITAVVQTNSATAEESAAASEELSGQAVSLKNELSKFKLKEVTDEC